MWRKPIWKRLSQLGETWPEQTGLAQANYFLTDCDAKNCRSILIRPQLTSQVRCQTLSIHTDTTPVNLDNSSRGRSRVQNIANRNTHAREIQTLPLGAKVWIEHHETKKWDRQAIIIEIRQDGRSSLLETAIGTQLLRGRRFIKLC